MYGSVRVLHARCSWWETEDMAAVKHARELSLTTYIDLKAKSLSPDGGAGSSKKAGFSGGILPPGGW